MCTHTQIRPQEGKLHLAGVATGLQAVRSERSDQPWANKLRVGLDVPFKHSWAKDLLTQRAVRATEDMGQDV